VVISVKGSIKEEHGKRKEVRNEKSDREAWSVFLAGCSRELH